jgi:hypothetical protein
MFPGGRRTSSGDHITSDGMSSLSNLFDSGPPVMDWLAAFTGCAYTVRFEFSGIGAVTELTGVLPTCALGLHPRLLTANSQLVAAGALVFLCASLPEPHRGFLECEPERMRLLWPGRQLWLKQSREEEEMIR